MWLGWLGYQTVKEFAKWQNKQTSLFPQSRNTGSVKVKKERADQLQNYLN